jgi:phage tail protein X
VIDTLDERRSGLPWLWCLAPLPDGTLDADDRRQVSGVWAFRTALDAWPPGPPRRAEEAQARPVGSLYLTAEGDTLDWLCWRHYGRTAGTVEAVLSANPGLAHQGPELPAGLFVWLPEVPAAPEATAPRLWDESAPPTPDDLGRPQTASAASAVYRTAEGDTLDWLCWRHYGAAGHEAAVLEANPGLADLGPELTSGLHVTLPVLPKPAAQAVPLWP